MLVYDLPDFKQIYTKPRPRVNNQALILQFKALGLNRASSFHDRAQPGPRRVHGFGEKDKTVR